MPGQPGTPHAAMARAPMLDRVRAASALAVVVSHYGVWWVALLPSAVAAIQLCGQVGVEAFFSLSGMLIGTILLRDRPAGASALGRFWARRLLRTMPLFALVAAVHYVLLPPGPGDAPLWRYLTHTAFVPLLGQPREVWFSVSWSLAVEEWSYLLFPLLLAVAFRRGGRGVPVLALAIFGLLLVRYSLVWMGLPQADVLIGTPFRMDPIAWGMLASALRPRPGWQSLLCRYGGAGLVTLYALVWVAGFPWVVSQPLYQTLGLTMLDVGLATCLAGLRILPGNGGRGQERMAALAALSYPIYLVHLPLARALGAHPVALGQALANTVLCLAATLAISVLLHRFVEHPCMRWGERFR